MSAPVPGDRQLPNDYLRYDTREERFVKGLMIMGGTDMGELDPAATVLTPELAVLPGHLIWRAAAKVTAALSETLPPGGDIHAYAALLALAAGQARSQQWLADTVAVSRTTMTKVVAQLVDGGLVERL